MGEARFFLKFGKKKHIEEFAEGSLFCSNAETFWGIEKGKKIKGQGDVLEAGTRMFGQRMTLQEHGSDNITLFNVKANALVHFEPAQNIPVFCLFTVYNSDCSKDDEGNYSICLTEETKTIIREHFPNADTVAIINDPQQFIQDIVDSIGYRVESGQVQYFNIDKGLDAGDGKVAMDMAYLKYLMQDVPPVKEDGKLEYVFRVEFVYRALFCKDVFFMPEQEYRIVLPDEAISEGKHYPIKLSKGIQVMPMDEFMK